ncbi:MAG TPA: hypothetical protein VHH36_04310 [Candidatus Thermoplasmatota archaeon]|nr:hypothetical protein [Candidatus Thermoplasmatota archaeon]
MDLRIAPLVPIALLLAGCAAPEGGPAPAAGDDAAPGASAVEGLETTSDGWVLRGNATAVCTAAGVPTPLTVTLLQSACAQAFAVPANATRLAVVVRAALADPATQSAGAVGLVLSYRDNEELHGEEGAVPLAGVFYLSGAPGETRTAVVEGPKAGPWRAALAPYGAASVTYAMEVEVAGADGAPAEALVVAPPS